MNFQTFLVLQAARCQGHEHEVAVNRHRFQQPAVHLRGEYQHAENSCDVRRNGREASDERAEWFALLSAYNIEEG